jgi:hypothetical protein
MTNRQARHIGTYARVLLDTRIAVWLPESAMRAVRATIGVALHT